MIIKGLKAVDFCEQVVFEEIKQRGGIRAAMGNLNVALLYSGPSRELQKVLGIRHQKEKHNRRRAEKQAIFLGLKNPILEQTPIGQWLESIDLETYFSSVYKNDPEVKQAIYDVWAYVSCLFIRSGFTEVVTVVCGADPTRVFREHEIYELVNASCPEVINGRSMQPIRKTYKAMGEYVTFREICRTELDMARKRALLGNTAEAWNDFRERLKFFRMECKETGKTLKAIGRARVAATKQTALALHIA